MLTWIIIFTCIVNFSIATPKDYYAKRDSYTTFHKNARVLSRRDFPVKDRNDDLQLPYYLEKPEELIRKVPYKILVPVPKPYQVKVKVPKPYTVMKKVPVPVKVYVPRPYTVEKKVPYPVKVPVIVPQPYQVERKIPYKVQIPIEKPYEVQVPKPYPVLLHKAGSKTVLYRVKLPVGKPVDAPNVASVPDLQQILLQSELPKQFEKLGPQAFTSLGSPHENSALIEVEAPQHLPNILDTEKNIGTQFADQEWKPLTQNLDIQPQDNYEYLVYEDVKHNIGGDTDFYKLNNQNSEFEDLKTATSDIIYGKNIAPNLETDYKVKNGLSDTNFKVSEDFNQVNGGYQIPQFSNHIYTIVKQDSDDQSVGQSNNIFVQSKDKSTENIQQANKHIIQSNKINSTQDIIFVQPSIMPFFAPNNQEAMQSNKIISYQKHFMPSKSYNSVSMPKIGVDEIRTHPDKTINYKKQSEPSTSRNIITSPSNSDMPISINYKNHKMNLVLKQIEQEPRSYQASYHVTEEPENGPTDLNDIFKITVLNSDAYENLDNLKEHPQSERTARGERYKNIMSNKQTETDVFVNESKDYLNNYAENTTEDTATQDWMNSNSNGWIPMHTGRK